MLGYCSYKNYFMSQHENVPSVFRGFIDEIKPKRILEIGTYTGGFIVMLKDICDDLNIETNIRTYDITNREKYDEIKSMGIDLRIQNLFTDNYRNISESFRDEFIDFIQSEGCTLILCDGGNKIKEFNLLAKYMKPGDYIMAHDYSHSQEYYQANIRNKVWNWCEITESDIAQVCESESLVDHKRDLFQSVVWVCKRRQK